MSDERITEMSACMGLKIGVLAEVFKSTLISCRLTKQDYQPILDKTVVRNKSWAVKKLSYVGS